MKKGPVILILAAGVALLLIAGGVWMLRPAGKGLQQKLFDRVKLLLSTGKTPVAAVTNDSGLPVPPDLTGLTVGGIIVSARPTATLNCRGQIFTVMAGDTLELPLNGGKELARCEKIGKDTVWLVFPRNNSRAELPLVK